MLEGQPVLPWLRSLTGYQRLGVATMLGVLALVALGGTVRVTDSGLACPDWPLCNGKVIPEGDYHVWIEWGHRLLASVMGIVIIAFVVGAVLKHRARRWVVGPALAAIVVLGVQVMLGGLTVTEDLSAGLVSAHLAVAMVLVLLLLTAWLVTFVPARGRPQPPEGRTQSAPARQLARLSVATALTLLSLVIVGAYVSASEAGFFCGEDWPLCNGSLLPEGGPAGVQVAHRYLAVFTGLLIVATWLVAFRARRSAPDVFRLTTIVAGLFALQVLLGAALMWSGLAEGVRVAHLVVATATWAGSVTAAAFAVYHSGALPSLVVPPRGQAATSRAHPQPLRSEGDALR